MCKSTGTLSVGFAYVRVLAKSVLQNASYHHRTFHQIGNLMTHKRRQSLRLTLTLKV